jgi:hypothetical protein
MISDTNQDFINQYKLLYCFCFLNDDRSIIIIIIDKIQIFIV